MQSFPCAPVNRAAKLFEIVPIYKILISLVGVMALTTAFAPRAQASLVFTLIQSGSNVVATGSGTLDLAGLTPMGAGSSAEALVYGSAGLVGLGPTAGTGTLLYKGGITGPSSFGTGSYFFPTSGTGTLVAISGADDEIVVPLNFISGSEITDSDTWANSTFASLGLTPGTYVYTWSSDSITVQIGPVASSSAPEPASVTLFSASLGILAILRRRRAARASKTDF